MKREWKKILPDQFQLFIDSVLKGHLHFFPTSNENKVEFLLDHQKLTIKRTGFWKSTIEITNEKNERVLSISPKKWLGQTWVLTYMEKEYEVLIRNNPLAEWIIKDGDLILLAYGLHLEGKNISLKISSHPTQVPFIFDYVLWYLFMPILSENSDDTMTINLHMNT